LQRISKVIRQTSKERLHGDLRMKTIILGLIAFFCLIGVCSSSVQTFNSEFGTVTMDLPFKANTKAIHGKGNAVFLEGYKLGHGNFMIIENKKIIKDDPSIHAFYMNFNEPVIRYHTAIALGWNESERTYADRKLPPMEDVPKLNGVNLTILGNNQGLATIKFSPTHDPNYVIYLYFSGEFTEEQMYKIIETITFRPIGESEARQAGS
jgi:hypothetical protein